MNNERNKKRERERERKMNIFYNFMRVLMDAISAGSVVRFLFEKSMLMTDLLKTSHSKIGFNFEHIREMSLQSRSRELWYTCSFANSHTLTTGLSSVISGSVATDTAATAMRAATTLRTSLRYILLFCCCFCCFFTVFIF